MKRLINNSNVDFILFLCMIIKIKFIEINKKLNKYPIPSTPSEFLCWFGNEIYYAYSVTSTFRISLKKLLCFSLIYYTSTFNIAPINPWEIFNDELQLIRMEWSVLFERDNDKKSEHILVQHN
jgi:hypothetical protein